MGRVLKKGKEMSNKEIVKLKKRKNRVMAVLEDINDLNQVFKRKPNRKRIPVDETKLAKYNRGEAVNVDNVKISINKEKAIQKESSIQYSVEQAARAELLLTEQGGYLEADDGEVSTQFNQTQIVSSLDPASASKRFDLFLNDFGPYRMNFTRNGRFLLLGGRKGHVAAMDWMSRKLMCEINVMESVHDVAWLHQETLFATAQKKWVYFYDNQGVEIHCVKNLNDVFKMMFLPYHFLLATVSNTNYISWLDVSIGKLVQQFHLKSHGTVSSVAQSPSNALVCVGLPSGVVNFWSPNSKKPAVVKWCHKQPISAIGFDPKGLLFATASMDKSIKLWDARNLNGPLENYHVHCPPQSVTFSQKGLMALASGNTVTIYNNRVVQSQAMKKVYLRHCTGKTIMNMEFCPFEDVLGLAHSGGYTSILVPGSGEPNFDAIEINPFQTKSQRKEREVQALLNKIPADLISFDPQELRKVHTPSLQAIIEAKKQLMHVKPPDIKFVPKKKAGKLKGTASATKRKKIVKEEMRKKYFQAVKETKKMAEGPKKKTTPTADRPKSVLDRFSQKPYKK